MFAIMRLASNSKADLNTKFQTATSDVGGYYYYGNLSYEDRSSAQMLFKSSICKGQPIRRKMS